jgi:hypothetical protein|tara:strand:- start:5733 stop:5990 length:258 start_codon:yes stop_codon:yes gene_type:complete
MRKYLEALITEKGRSIHDDIKGVKSEVYGEVYGDVIGLTYDHLIDFIEANPHQHAVIKNNLVKIDFKNGDVFHFLTYLANGMANA